LKKARKLLRKNGQMGSAAEKALSDKWFATIREHSRLSRALRERQETIRSFQQQKLFKKNPMKFGANLFQKKTFTEPTFSPEEGLSYFTKLYQDENRSHSFVPLDGMKRPASPRQLFSEACPSQKEIADVLRSKRNASAPGPNGISYVPYKRCPALLPLLQNIFSKVWKTGDVPPSWAAANILLFAKTNSSSNPADFRPIALTNTIGKIFFSVFSKRLERFMHENAFTSFTQKGFKAGTPGCLEHSFAMFEALLDAKHEQRQIVVTWLDLCNAYGSVKHNLIQFALHWYHVPEPLCQLLLRYYDSLHACIKTKKWTTTPFQFNIGLFQGCVISCVLFSCVFQLLLDFLKPLTDQHGYHFKNSSIVLHDQAFADDLSITTSSPKSNQATLDVVMIFLIWAFFKPKPVKCICMGMKKFDPSSDPGRFHPHGDTVYAPFDPDLNISGEKIKFIVNVAADPTSLQYDHFKELGRFISVDLSEDKIKTEIRKRLLQDIDTVQTSGVNGLCKLFLYEHFIISRLSWFFLVHDLSLTFAQELDDKVP
jgi:hypothetical protein